jgi:hypothetical protein
MKSVFCVFSYDIDGANTPGVGFQQLNITAKVPVDPVS